jgi:SAM-dependent methyltransferase
VKRRDCDWQEYVRKDYDFGGFTPGSWVLDLGCGDGEQLAGLRAQRARAIGIDPYRPSLEECRRQRLPVAQARAEELPVKDACLDGLICKGVIPYTIPSQAFTEIRRVLKDGAAAHCTYLGAGYYLRYLLYPNHWRGNWKYNFYGLRTLLNTWLVAVSGLRLPRFLGDTVYQSRRRVAKHYRENNLLLVRDTPSRTFLGFPVFIYHAIRKVAS